MYFCYIKKQCLKDLGEQRRLQNIWHTLLQLMCVVTQVSCICVLETLPVNDPLP